MGPEPGLGPVGPGTGRGLGLTLTGCFRGKDAGPEPKARGLCDSECSDGSSGRAWTHAADVACRSLAFVFVHFSVFPFCAVPLSRFGVHHGEAACFESKFRVFETVPGLGRWLPPAAGTSTGGPPCP